METQGITEDEYRAGMDFLAMVARNLLSLKLDAMLETVRVADSATPILDPTAYRDGGAERLRDQRELLEAFVGVRDAARKIAGEAGEG